MSSDNQKIEMGAEGLSMELIQVLSQVDARIEESKQWTKQSIDLQTESLQELCSKIDLCIQNASQFVHAIQEIQLEAESIQRLNTQINTIDRLLERI
jgi:hypothetical protein